MTPKINVDFIKNNKELIIDLSIENAKRLYDDAELLMNNRSYATAHGRIIEALEELAKASLLRDNKFSDLKRLISHREKAIEIMNLSAQCYQIPTISRERVEWAQETNPTNERRFHICETRNYTKKQNKTR
jgi:AbiV family abortive infection protein